MRFAALIGRIVLGIGLAGPASAADTEAAVPRWGRWQASFTATQPVEKPSNVTLSLQLTSPSGQTLRTFGFWDGGPTWRVRFLPGETGTWKFAAASEPAIAGLDGQAGQFVCRAAQEGDAALPRGPLQVAPSGTYLQRADGTPFFWLGDTVWNGPLLATKADWSAFLPDRVAKRFSVLQFNLLAPWRTAQADELGQVAYTGRDDVQLQPQFFQRMDERIDAINAHGLVAVPVLLWTLGQADASPGQLPDDQCVKLARYLVARYQAHDVCWILPGDENYSGQRGERWRRIGRAVFPADMPRAPVTLHPQGMQWHLEPLRGEPWIDFLGYQSGHGDDARTLAWIHSGPAAQSWQNRPLKPILNLEPPYEGHLAYQSRQPHSDYSVRRACYWSLLATPVAGLTYGGHGIWSWQTRVGLPQDHPRTGEAQPWQTAKDLPGSGQMKHLADLFTSLRWTDLRPAPTLVRRPPGSDDPARFIAASQTPDKNQTLVYLPLGGEVSLDPAQLPSSLQARWFDPRTASRQPASPTSPGRFEAPDTQDWVLILVSAP